MSDQWRGPGWWYASDGKWYPPADVSARFDEGAQPSNAHIELLPDRASTSTPPPPPPSRSTAPDVSEPLPVEKIDLSEAPKLVELEQLEVIDLADSKSELDDRQLAMASARPESALTDVPTGWVQATAGSTAGESEELSSSGSSGMVEVERDESDRSESRSGSQNRLSGEGPEVRSSQPPTAVTTHDSSEPSGAPRSSVVFIAALLLALLSGVLGALWLRERAISADLRAEVAEASQQQSEIDLTDLEDALNTARVQNQQLEQQVADMSALVLELPAGRLTEISVPFDPVFADESSGRLIAISAEGEYVIWGNGADRPITDSGTLPDVPTGLFAGSARSWISTEAGLVEVLPMRPEIAPEDPIEYGPLVHVVASEDARSYWSYNTELGQIVRLERNGGAVTDAVSVPVTVVDITIGAGSVWALGDDGLVYRINTADLTLQSFDLGPDLISVTAGPDALWTLSAADGSLRRVDPVTGLVLVTVPVGRDPIDAIFAGSSVWVGLRSGSSMIEVDTATSAVVSRTELSSEPAQLYEGDSGVYVSTVGEGSPLLRIDSLSSTVDADEQTQDAAEGAEGE